MKRKIFSIALLLSVVASLLTSCMVAQERGNRGYRDKYRKHGGHRGGPYDSNRYDRNHRY